MSVQNEMRRVKKTNLEYKARRLRGEIDNLATTIRINIDTSMSAPESLPVAEIDQQFDALKYRWSELAVTLAEIARLEEELR